MGGVQPLLNPRRADAGDLFNVGPEGTDGGAQTATHWRRHRKARARGKFRVDAAIHESNSIVRAAQIASWKCFWIVRASVAAVWAAR